MNTQINVLLDQCIDRINDGESLEVCLASHPEDAHELEPLLQVLCDAKTTCSTMPRPTAIADTRNRLHAAVAEADMVPQETQRRFPFFGSLRIWAALSTALVLALIGFGANWMLTPAVAPVVEQPNFRLLLSDDENAINDFSKLEVTISSIGLLPANEHSQWEIIDLKRDAVVDLTRLGGLNAQSIWSGGLAKGQYSSMFITIEKVNGKLKSSNGSPPKVSLAGGIFQISKSFTIGSGDSVVNFVYDITVFKSVQDDVYFLEPQENYSGADQTFHEVGEGQLTLWVVDTATPVIPGE